MANPTARQRLIMQAMRQAANGLPIFYEASGALNSALTAAGIPHEPYDATYRFISGTNNQALETLARAIEASRLNGQDQLVDAIFVGERFRQNLGLEQQADQQADQATATQTEADAIEGVTF